MYIERHTQGCIYRGYTPREVHTERYTPREVHTGRHGGISGVYIGRHGGIPGV